MRVFNWTFLLRAALAVPIAGLIGAAVSTLTTGKTVASTKPNCVANDWARMASAAATALIARTSAPTRTIVLC